jgi:hypothetical protein
MAGGVGIGSALTMDPAASLDMEATSGNILTVYVYDVQYLV